MNGNRSVATISDPEFINLEQDAINPGISKCEIKVFYLGENRNRSYINKNTAIQMANSLPGTPIVGAYRKDIEDFGDHGQIMHIEDGKIEFSCKTIPYGFVAPDAEVWFQKFIDIDEFENEIEREYLMTTGYLWTGQYPEVMKCITEGKGQSMELDEETLDGHWATNPQSGIEFFIINDAIFSKLCILGDDVEPCFEGAAVTAPEISKNFSYDTEFSKTLFTMMNELKFALQNKGGSDMPKDFVEEAASEEVETSFEEAADTNESASDEVITDFEDIESAGEDVAEVTQEFAAEEAPAEEESTEDVPVMNSLEVSELQEQLASLSAELEELRAFKLAQENKEKDTLINKYHMLSDEDKAEIVANKEQYSLDEIEAKLALIYVHKNVDFSTLTGEIESFETPEEEEPTMVFSLDDTTVEFVPPMVEALRQVKNI